MSSMVRRCTILLLAGTAIGASAPTVANDAADWDRARQQLVASQPGPMADAIARWQELSASERYSFGDYAGFILTYPGLPDEDKLQATAEKKLLGEAVDGTRLVAFFDRFKPVTNPARAQYALALAADGRPEAPELARAAWRNGVMSETAEATLLSLYGPMLTQADHDARMDALLWERDLAEASRQLPRTSFDKRFLYEARMVAIEGGNPQVFNSAGEMGALEDPGYLYNLSRRLRADGRYSDAVNLLATRPKLSRLPYDQADWVEELLTVARRAGPSSAVAIAASVDDAFPPGTDISTLGFGLRDDYTSLVWLGGTTALWELGNPAKAAPLFYRYGAAAQTTQTRAKGFYWAGLAARKAGQSYDAISYFEQAAQYPERFYGQLALEELGRDMPKLDGEPEIAISDRARTAFQARPLTRAVREVARDAPWRVGIRFYREIANQAQSEEDLALVAELARDIGRRDLAVITGEAAGSKGVHSFTSFGFPTLQTPPATNWTMIHAITRQESQFAQNAISHAGARGLMQLMPGTAQEQAGKLGIQYLSASLIDDAEYNVRLGEGYFGRMLDYYRGSYPLAIAAYNAGPGNVNKWLKANGDPRDGSIDWIEWIERIPIYETKNYVQRVIENAVVYENMYPERGQHGHKHQVSNYLRTYLGG